MHDGDEAKDHWDQLSSSTRYDIRRILQPLDRRCRSAAVCDEVQPVAATRLFGSPPLTNRDVEVSESRSRAGAGVIGG